MMFNNSSLESYDIQNATDPGSTYSFYKTEQLVFLLILFVTIVVGNVMILAAIVVSRKRKSRMNMFIINLACADLAVGCVLVLTDIVWKLTITWYAGNVGCKLVKFAQCVTTYGATYSLVALSIDRLDAIARPMSINNVERQCRLLIGLVWIFAGFFSSPMLFMSEEVVVSGTRQCWVGLQMDIWMWQVYMLLVSIAVFVVPAVIIASCYIAIVVIIWSNSNKFKSITSHQRNEKIKCISKSGSLTVRINTSTTSHCTVGTNSASSSRGVIPKAKIKTIKMTFVIVLAFVFCWSPYFIWDLLDVFEHIEKSQQSVAVSTFIQSLAPLNSAANPIIYILFNTALCTRILRKPRGYNSPPHSAGITTI